MSSGESGRGEQGRSKRGGKGGGLSPEMERGMALAFAVQEVLDHTQDEPYTQEMQPKTDKLRMVTTSQEGQASSSEVVPLTEALEADVKRYGLAREVGELIMANRKNGMRRYAGIHEIIPGLHLSGMAVLQGDSKQLKEAGVTAVLSLTDFTLGKLPSEVRLHKHVNVADSLSASLEEHLEPCANWIHQAMQSGHKVLVHCVAGVSRSASIVIGYLMIHKGYSLKDARDLTKKKRPCTRPNEAFTKQLEALESSLPRNERQHSSSGMTGCWGPQQTMSSPTRNPLEKMTITNSGPGSPTHKARPMMGMHMPGMPPMGLHMGPMGMAPMGMAPMGMPMSPQKMGPRHF